MLFRSPATGEYLQQIVAETVATPPDVVAAAKIAINTQGVVKGSVAKPGDAGQE